MNFFVEKMGLKDGERIINMGGVESFWNSCPVPLKLTVADLLGTTEEEVLPRVTSGGLKVGEDIFLVYSPEREDLGNAYFSTHTIPKVAGGHTSEYLTVGQAVYALAIDHVVPSVRPRQRKWPNCWKTSTGRPLHPY